MQLKPSKSTSAHLLGAIHIALVLLSVALMLVASLRTEQMRHVFKVLWLVESATLVYRTFRTGRLRQTPEGSIDGLMNGTITPITTPLERIACLTALVAWAVLATT